MSDQKHESMRKAVLALTLLGLALECLVRLYLKLPEGLAAGIRMTVRIFLGILMVEQLVRYVAVLSSRGEHARDEHRAYLLLHKAEILFFVLTPFCLIQPIGFVLLLKLPYALGILDDEKVFQKIANAVAILLILIFLIPFLHVIASALSGPGTIVGIWPVNPDLYSIRYAGKDMAFLKSMGISLFVTVVGTTLSIVAMTMAAYPLSKPEMPLRKTMMIFFMICMLFTGGMAPKILLMNTLHLNNTIWALILPIMVNVVHLLLLKGFFEDIPAELEESAKLDGASNYTILFRIVVPVAAPMIATVVFSKMVEYWNNIETSVLYITSNQSIYPLPMYIKNVMNQNLMEISSNNPTLRSYWDHVKMAYILLSILPILLPYPLIFKYIKNGVTIGAVKG